MGLKIGNFYKFTFYHFFMLTQSQIQQISEWLSRGYSEEQITATLSQQGFQPKDISDAISKAKEMRYSSVLNSSASSENIEDLVDSVVEEKWTDLIKIVDDFKSWKEAMENRMLKIETEIKDVKENFKNLQDSVVGKIGEYDDHLVKIGSNVKAIEKVFRRVIPVFVENVNELDRIVKELKNNQSSSGGEARDDENSENLIR